MSVKSKVEELTQLNVETIAKLEQFAFKNRSTGEKIADFVASKMGSWTFIIIQSSILIVWVACNISYLIKPWDPYPFILLNLALSFQAAYASPIIMMSQNRQARVSERRNHLDLQINLLAEQESTEILKLLRTLCKAQGIDPGESAAAFSQTTKPLKVVEQIQEYVEKSERLSNAAPKGTGTGDDS